LLEDVVKLFEESDEVDREIRKLIDKKGEVYKKIAGRLNDTLAKEIKDKLGYAARVLSFQDYEDSTIFNLYLVVYCKELDDLEVDDKLKREDEILQEVYKILDEMLPKKYSVRISVLPADSKWWEHYTGGRQ